ncbi:pre-rRNA-processing protein TSR1 homolog [Sphaerodactylus townsendi]|uniref:Ribosome biogenesis protein tsr1 n=1 Tax=Sphaerodactylus townsendi TaxID=933632 RepID=A0ACB8ED16_9SAUR|nr:pre-rRNA-processing protein TSR1 homolog [Sphaerodactylus townsendi]XP_048375426.1 pre-rRNA-processing protein TSR1 homolog [Sphaerodactylus townsendi]
MVVPKEGGGGGHRPGALKQQNKPHKAGRHRRNSTRRHAVGVSAKTLSHQKRQNLAKMDRKHRASQLRKQSKEAVLAEKRNLGHKGGPPHLVVVVPLHANVDSQSVLHLFQSNEASVVCQAERGFPGFVFQCPRSKLRWQFVVADRGNLLAILDLAKVADTLLFVLDLLEGWDAIGNNCLSCIFAQGLPNYGLAVQGLADEPLKKQIDLQKKLRKVTEKRFPEAKLFPLDTEQESALLLHHLATQKQRHLAFRDRRAHLLTEAVEFVPGPGSDLVGTLKVSGYVRGRSLNVNSLVHIVGHGDFQMSQVDATPEPFVPNLNAAKGQRRRRQGLQDSPFSGVAEMEEDVQVLMRADPNKQESLQSEMVPDPMDGEQTWPTEEELNEAAESLKQTKKISKKVPKGTSAYQAAWIVNEREGESGSDDEQDEANEMEEEMFTEEAISQDGSSSEEEEATEDEECESMVLPETEEDAEEEEAVLEKYQRERQDEMFPDEVDTPRDVLAKIRFQKYRGLKSFRTSPWDPNENLPRDYARIFQFQDFFQTRKHVFRQLKKEEDDGVAVGRYVTLHICNAPASVVESFQQRVPLVLYELLPYEQKMSVLNLLVRRFASYTEPIQAKEEVIVHCGFRRFQTSPLYSQHSSGSKHKLEKFLRADGTTMATLYGPITFPPASVLFFKQKSDGSHDLLATGSLHSVDPSRVILKRVVLSGHPFKIHTKMAVVRYMFFNREDVLWFKPVALRTKWGRRGHIKEPVGTHGLMKCQFDGQLKSQDTVLMTLYKRVFPKWIYNSHVPGLCEIGESALCHEEEMN